MSRVNPLRSGTGLRILVNSDSITLDAVAQLGLLDDDAIPLDVGALRLAALDHPRIDLNPYVELLGDITERVVTLGTVATSAQARAKILARVFAVEFGFAGDRESYDDPDNADLVRVIDRRLGLPVSLTILYVAAARRMGWQADVLNTPGHVLGRLGSATEPVLIDPFNGGAIVELHGLASLMQRMLGPTAVPTQEHLSPMSNRSTLVRLLMNQASRAEAAGNLRRALTLFERMTVIAPDHGHAWWERARLQLLDGDDAGARSSLSAMLEVTRDATIRLHICAALDALARR
jgi:regulator of sirC expression with transglutaminase-like and TPR domain